MKICCISDTHGIPLSQLDLPEADILIHAGDMSFKGTITEMSMFNEYCGEVKHKFKHGIWACMGNHELGVEENTTLHKSIATNYNMKIHDEVVVDGIKFFFSSYTPWFHSWAWNLHRGKPLEDKWAQIPLDTRVLITHGGPRFHLAKTVSGEDVGCLDLHNRTLQLLDLKLHVFGHIHAAHGIETSLSEVTYVNASICNEKYYPANKPFLIEVN